MIRAYDKVYLEDAMRNLGEAFDYVSSHLKIKLDEFLDLFIASGIAEQFGRGVPKFVSGLSGIELAMEVLTKAGKDLTFPESDVKYSFSSEYWCGWILAYYQWHSGRKYSDPRQRKVLRSAGHKMGCPHRSFGRRKKLSRGMAPNVPLQLQPFQTSHSFKLAGVGLF